MHVQASEIACLEPSLDRRATVVKVSCSHKLGQSPTFHTEVIDPIQRCVNKHDHSRPDLCLLAPLRKASSHKTNPPTSGNSGGKPHEFLKKTRGLSAQFLFKTTVKLKQFESLTTKSGKWWESQMISSDSPPVQPALRAVWCNSTPRRRPKDLAEHRLGTLRPTPR